MMPITLKQIAAATDGQLLGDDAEIQHLSTDTRTLQAGSLFIALIGDNFNGNEYAAQAVSKGAVAVLLSSHQPELTASQIVVKDTTEAFGQLANWYRHQWGKQLIAITGSCGKTTVKGMVSAILSPLASTWATQGNLNNHIGVPKTLLALEQQHEFAVVEMGASGPGEIGYLTKIAKPQIALVNNVVPAHLEGFGSIEAIAETKGEIYDGLAADGTAVVNLDDQFAGFWLENIGERMWIGFSVEGNQADVYARDIAIDETGCAQFILCARFGEIPVQLQVLGRANVANALAAASCAIPLGIKLDDIKAGLENFTAVAGRLAIVKAKNGARLIDDSYNANPGSVQAAIDVLAAMPGQKILVLGDMGELGDEAMAAHIEVGQYANKVGLDGLLSVGELSKLAAQKFGPGGQNFISREALITELEPLLNKDATILIKGSRSAGMDQVARAIAVNGENQ